MKKTAADCTLWDLGVAVGKKETWKDMWAGTVKGTCVASRATSDAIMKTSPRDISEGSKKAWNATSKFCKKIFDV